MYSYTHTYTNAYITLTWILMETFKLLNPKSVIRPTTPKVRSMPLIITLLTVMGNFMHN